MPDQVLMRVVKIIAMGIRAYSKADLFAMKIEIRIVLHFPAELAQGKNITGSKQLTFTGLLCLFNQLAYLHAQRGDFATAMDAMVRSGFREDADPDVVAWVRDKAIAANPEVAIALIDALLDNDLKRALADVSVPIRCINSAIGLATNVEANRRYGDFDAVILDAGGHFQHLESPARFNSEMSKLLNQLD